LIRKLTKEHAKCDNTIVLQAIAMDSDPENTISAAIVNDGPSIQACTMGVLTKPDNLRDTKATWKDITKGKAFPKGYGYMVVRQPSPAEADLNPTIDKAKEVEVAFFKQTPQENYNSWKARFPDVEETQLGVGSVLTKLNSIMSAMLDNE
jgi:hypothetical protein